ncbi:hypothetical protein BGW41_000323 [Actinomortierella wolfii]|nr:hypothetical protein BGW41_000323 [Actinomortierella wolfii]
MLSFLYLYCLVIPAVVSAITADSKLFNKWTKDIERARRELGIQGASVAVVHKGKIIYAQGFGKRNDKDPFTPYTLSRIASMTKAFTAATVGELVADNKAKWDTSIKEYYPEFKVKDPLLTSQITFTDLLSHRTGLPAIGREWVHRPEPLKELIRQLQHLEAEAPLRTKYIYSDRTYTIAGEAAARIANKPYEELVLEKVTRPLGMKETGFSMKTLISRPNHAVPYSCKNFAAARRGENYRMPIDKWEYTDVPAAGLFSNVIELANWAKAILHFGELDGKQVLSGALPGYRSFINLFPDDDLAIINLSNNKIDQLVETIPFYIADDILDLPKTRNWLFDVAVQDTAEVFKWFGKEDPSFLEAHFPPQERQKPTTRALSDFVGEYTHPYGGKISFKLTSPSTNATDQKQGQLTFQFRDFDGVLEHYHFDSFRLRVINDIMAFSNLVTFITGDDGAVKQCRILKDDGVYLFTKV